jgi:hypothetical protein
MVRGLNLQGGSSLLIELETKEMLDTWIVRQVADIRAALCEARVGSLRPGALPAPISYISMTTDSGTDAGAKKQDP